jgi:hypothetical protein
MAGTDTAASLLSYLKAANGIWSQAGIRFVPGHLGASTYVRVIGDPEGSPGQQGDIGLPSDYLPNDREAVTAVDECKSAWGSAGGLTLVDIRYFVNQYGVHETTLGISSPLPPSLSLMPPTRYCREPRTIKPDEEASGFSLVIDPSEKNFGDPIEGLSHELGHLLLLVHGDGIDNNGNGPYDRVCDPGEPDAGQSLMSPEESATN